ncbi:SSI family serine proteinase inhibitor [Lentzea flaviverrucosa]|uniref:Subtilisin inhibitor-like n=1 Tax=Lentzea flaviverrucosa TaxID=200379 RepID=A0A1H9G880_9PSEU|nr:SSI family serine proteinase inhibitor [Lentzea flaviverrucosa]RDI34984.1 subtilisin inhibitor-like [Lentzea flaviverrucosa]SEQ46327.1 Subtilisin inhibitor-like [Lentzea flaviverrucosa]
MSGRILAFVALFVSLFAFTGTAQATPAAPASRGGTALVLTAQYSEFDGGAFKATVLTCERGDQHPRRALACATLASAGADLQTMQADGRACTFHYAPVEVAMFGFWRGEPVSEVHTYPNSCVMLAHTGALFDF